MCKPNGTGFTGIFLQEFCCWSRNIIVTEKYAASLVEGRGHGMQIDSCSDGRIEQLGAGG